MRRLGTRTPRRLLQKRIGPFYRAAPVLFSMRKFFATQKKWKSWFETFDFLMVPQIDRFERKTDADATTVGSGPGRGNHISLCERTFPLAKITFPFGERTFPLVEITFPLGERTFPLADITVPLAVIRVPLAYMTFPLAEITFPLVKTHQWNLIQMGWMGVRGKIRQRSIFATIRKFEFQRKNGTPKKQMSQMKNHVFLLMKTFVPCENSKFYTGAAR